MPKINPFEPNSPINPAMFVGRLEELQVLKSCLIQTRADKPRSFMLTGERGIGKSSLLNYLKFVAQGLIPIAKEKVRFLVIDTDIDANTTQLGLVKKIELGVRKELAKSEKARAFLGEAWAFIQRVEAASVKINAG